MNVLSLCSGVGGLELGLQLAIPTRTVCYVEKDLYCAAVIAQRMQDRSLEQALIYDDLKSFSGKSWRGLVDIITAGYPCQPFSLAGAQRGSEDPRHLWPDVYRVLQEVQPRYLFCENVSAHLRDGFDQVVRDLESAHYHVAAGIFTAWAVGAPHQRERLFFLATLADSCVPRIPPISKCCLEGTQAPLQRSVETVGSKEYLGASWPGGPSQINDIPRAIDGVSNRVDRSRALGNAVVPQMAAKAFVTLAGVL